MKNRNTKHSRLTVPTALVAVSAGWLLAIGLLFGPTPAGAGSVEAEIEVDAECVRACLTDLRACVAGAREAFVDCSTQGGCVELAASARSACAANRTASLCAELRADYSDCMKPCRTELRADVKSCQSTSLTCLHDQCNLSDLPGQCGRVSASVH